MPSISTYKVFCAPMAAIIQRLERAHAPGKLLAGMKITGAIAARAMRASGLWAPPMSESIANDQLPCVRIRGMAVQEGAPRMAGALKASSLPVNMNTPIEGMQQIYVEVMSSVDDGMLQPETSDACANLVWGHLDWVARVMDALERNASEVADATLDRTATSPITLAAAPQETDSLLYFSTVITVTVHTKTFHHAERCFLNGS